MGRSCRENLAARLCNGALVLAVGGLSRVRPDISRSRPRGDWQWPESLVNLQRPKGLHRRDDKSPAHARPKIDSTRPIASAQPNSIAYERPFGTIPRRSKAGE